MYLHFDKCEKSVRNNTKIIPVGYVFISISKEEKEMNVESKFATLSGRMQEEQSRPKNEKFKCPVGITNEEETNGVVEIKLKGGSQL